MRRIVIAGFVALLGTAAFIAAQDAEKQPPPKEAMKMPEPQKEHEWLKHYVGEWDAEIELTMEPGKPPEKSKGTENTQPIGGFWVLSEYKGTFMDRPFTGVMTLGYDPEKKKYIGTWVDSMNSHLWTYEGTVDAEGRILTLYSEGQCPAKPGERVKFKDTTEFKSRDHRVFSSSMQGEDGKWSTVMTAHYQRRK